MRCVDWVIETGYVSAIHEGTWEFADDEEITEEELEEMLQDEISNHISGSFGEPYQA